MQTSEKHTGTNDERLYSETFREKLLQHPIIERKRKDAQSTAKALKEAKTIRKQH